MWLLVRGTPLLKSLQEERQEGMGLTPRGSGRLVPGGEKT